MDFASLIAWSAQFPVASYAVRIGIVVGGYALASLLATWLAIRFGRAQQHDPDRIRGVLRGIRTLLRVGFASILLIVLGVDLALIPAFLGSFLAVVGVACFATWSVLSNITAGLVLYATKDLHAGDLVRIVGAGEEPIEGRIVEFRLWTLLLRREDGCTVLYPNNLFIQRPVTVLAKASTGRTTQLLQQPR